MARPGPLTPREGEVAGTNHPGSASHLPLDAVHPVASSIDTPHPAALTGSARRVLAERGVGGYRQYRIPAIVATSSGLICAFDARLNLDDLPAPIDLLLRRSPDFGDTWSAPEVVRTGSGFEGFGDPSLLSDPTTGRVLLFHSASIYAGFFESSGVLDDSDPHVQHADLSISDDGGRTWRHLRLSSALRASGNAHFSGSRIAGLFATSGAGAAIAGGAHAGRLVQPFVLRVGARIEVACALSDDHGETWRLGAPVPVSPHGGSAAELNESSVAALPGGTLVLHSRGVGMRWQAFSRDGGETFTPAEPVRELIDSGTNGSVIAVADTLFASHSADPDLRRRAVISRSEDHGRSWGEVRVVEPGAAGYTQLVALPGGEVGIIYEANGYQQILFQRLTPEQLSGTNTPAPSAPESVAPASAEGWNREVVGDLVYDVVLRSITPPDPEGEAGETHEIDLTAFGDIPATVFKEIGLGREETTQVLRTREGLLAAGPIAPGIHPGETLTFHARVRNTGSAARGVEWLGDTRVLEPGDSWIRRGLRYTSTAESPAPVPPPPAPVG